MNNLWSSPSALLPPIGIVICDAGAANIIAAWVPRLAKPLYVCAEGPAQKIIKKVWPLCELHSLEYVLENVKLILTGTGWSSDLEHRARLYASLAGIHSLAVIDHWVNYQARFIRNSEEVLPDGIVVTDEYAEREARRCFGSIPIFQWSNDYLSSEVLQVNMLYSKQKQQLMFNILITMEPIRTIWEGDALAGEFVALEYFFSKLHLLNLIPEKIHILIRPHPSELINKYDEIIKKYPLIKIDISQNFLLAEDIAWADWVVGCNSFALVVAIFSGRLALSILPPHAPKCVLPYRELRHLIDLDI